MLDIRLIRSNPDLVKERLRTRGSEETDAAVDALVALDGRRRQILVEVEELKHKRNVTSKEIGERKKRGLDAEELVAEMRAIGDRIDELDKEVARIDEEIQQRLLELPNLPHESVPLGKDESENVVVRTWGEPKQFDFEPKAHWDLGAQLDIIDFERGVKLSGSRFYVLKGAGAKLQRALIQWFLDTHNRENGYIEIYPPFMVKEKCMWNAGQLPKLRDNIYHDAEEDFWWVGTAEIPLTGLHADEILDGEQLPLRYVAYTPCFRREKMSAGRDVRGIKRGHQFDKVEQYSITTPETSYEELERIVACAEDLCRRLGFACRVVQICTGDLSFAAAKTYDIEVWAPGCGEWLEVSSCSNCTDFQARRANIRFRRAPKARPEYVHTLNGSGLALPRTMIAILENYQNPDGSVTVPQVLRPYMGGLEKIDLLR